MNGHELLWKALYDKGPAPEYHDQIHRKHRKEWPELWIAIDRLVLEYDGPLLHVLPLQPPESKGGYQWVNQPPR